MSKRAKAVARLEQFADKGTPRDDRPALELRESEDQPSGPARLPGGRSDIEGLLPTDASALVTDVRGQSVSIPAPVSVASQQYQDAYARFLEARQPRKNVGTIEGEPGAEFEVIEIGNGPDVKSRHRVNPGTNELRLVNRWAPLESPGLLYRRSESQRNGRALFMVHVEHVPDGGQAS